MPEQELTWGRGVSTSGQHNSRGSHSQVREEELGRKSILGGDVDDKPVNKHISRCFIISIMKGM